MGFRCRLLIRQGASGTCPTLTGHGPNAKRLGVKHHHCVTSVVNYIQRHGLNQVILVGHSFGGTVVQSIAAAIPDKVVRTVFVDALILEHNECVMDVLPVEYGALFCGLAEQSLDNTMLIPWEMPMTASS